MQDKLKSADLRKQHNADLIRRMRNGEPLNAIDSKASWYPPRPTIKKDVNELARLYGSAQAAARPAAPATVRRQSDQVIKFSAPSPAVPPSLDEAS